MTFTRIFTVTLFKIFKNWEQLKCLLIGERLNKYAAFMQWIAIQQFKKEEPVNTDNNVDSSHKHHVKKKNPGTARYTLYRKSATGRSNLPGENLKVAACVYWGLTGSSTRKLSGVLKMFCLDLGGNLMLTKLSTKCNSILHITLLFVNYASMK